LGLVFVLCVFPLCCWLVFSTGAVDCLERLVSEMTYYMLNGWLNHTHSLTRWFVKYSRVVLAQYWCSTTYM